MIGFLAPYAAAAALAGVTHSLLRTGWRSSRARKASRARRQLSPEEALACVNEFGMSANSFMTLYPGFEYFAHPDPSVRGMIAYSEQPDAWVGGAEPFCAPADKPLLLEAFAQAAAAQGKTAILLPVDERHAELARRDGWSAILIGTEPTFDLERYPRTGRTWNDVVPTAKQLASKGARVTEFHPASLRPGERAELDAITAEWLASRKMETLGFLNQVDPWFRSVDKRYFRIELHGRTLAFLAAIPIRARNGWYLIDLLRRGDTPAGSTELLLLQSMRLLRESGAREATMGVAPLSGLERAPDFAVADHPRRHRIYRLLRLVYERGNTFYNFKPLHQYKLKFDPSSHPPMFLIHRGPLGPRALLSLSRAFMPVGMVRATTSGAIRLLTRFSLSDWIRAQLQSSVVVRSAPPSWGRLLVRCKVTAALTAANLLLYAFTVDGSGRILPGLERDWGFSWEAFSHHPLHALALSPFLHWNAAHLILNLAGMLAFVGALEYLAGSAITAAAYGSAMLMANPIVGALLNYGLHPWLARANPAELDVGASLGIYGCAGALAGFLRRGNWLLLALASAVLADALMRGSFMTLNHWVALALGTLLGRAWFRT